MSKYLIVILFFSVFSFAQGRGESSNDLVEEIEPAYYKRDVEEISDGQITDVARILDTIKYYHTDKSEQRSFSANLQDEYDSSDFDYSLTKPRESLWDKIVRKIEELLPDGLGFSIGELGNLKGVLKFILKAICGLTVLGIIYWLVILNKKGVGFFSKKAKGINPEAHTIKENIHEIDFNEIISKYELENNYRYAVRYQFLHLLKIFTDKHLIEWDPDKTNLDYINELAKRKEQSEFKKLTKIFDYVWYGEFDLEKENYERVKQSFNQLKQLPNE